jgi:GDPmannose 4,6-dehydratase
VREAPDRFKRRLRKDRFQDERAFGGVEGVDEVGYIKACNNPEYQLEIGKAVVAVDPKYFRPTEVELLIGDPTKSMTKLGWKPKYDLPALVKDMMSSDLALFKRDQYLQKGGHKIMNYYE